MKVLITGGAGFIGSHLARNLAEKHDVLVVDNFAHSTPASVPKGVRYLDWDVRNYLGDVLGDWHPEAIFHLAAVAPLPECERDPYVAISINVGGTAQVLRFAAYIGSKVLLASTSAVYESSGEGPFSENDYIAPNLIYSLTKKHSEDLANAYRLNYHLHITTMRLFNVYGSSNSAATRKHPALIPMLLSKLSKNEDVVLYCDSKTVARDMVYVEDVVEAMKTWLPTKILWATFNICSSQSYTLPEILKTCQSFFPNYSGQISFEPPQDLWSKYLSLFEGVKPLRKDRVLQETYKSSKGSSAYANKYLGWVAKYDLASGVADMLKV